MKKPKLKRGWEGLRVRTKRELRSGMYRFPSGTECRVIRNYGGLSLETETCKTCGVSVFITRVPEEAVEILGPWEESS